VLIGDVIVGADCYVGPGASLRGDFGRIEMKQGSNFQDNCTAHCFSGGGIVIGERGNIGHGAVLHGCTIGDRALVGMNAVVMDGAVIGDDCIVAALSFIRAGFEAPAATLVAAQVERRGVPRLSRPHPALPCVAGTGRGADRADRRAAGDRGLATTAYHRARYRDRRRVLSRLRWQRDIEVAAQ